MTNLFHMVTELDRINDKEKERECLEKVWDWYSQKIANTFITKITSTKKLHSTTMEEGDLVDDFNRTRSSLRREEDDVTQDPSKLKSNNESRNQFERLDRTANDLEDLTLKD